MKNREVADLFEKMADLLEFKDENPFKVRAYRRASRIIGDLTQDIEEIAQSGKLKDVPGIGEGMAAKRRRWEFESPSERMPTTSIRCG
jgi:DNA polymerase (family 10)